MVNILKNNFSFPPTVRKSTLVIYQSLWPALGGFRHTGAYWQSQGVNVLHTQLGSNLQPPGSHTVPIHPPSLCQNLLEQTVNLWIQICFSSALCSLRISVDLWPSSQVIKYLLDHFYCISVSCRVHDKSGLQSYLYSWSVADINLSDQMKKRRPHGSGSVFWSSVLVVPECLTSPRTGQWVCNIQ